MTVSAQGFKIGLGIVMMIFVFVMNIELDNVKRDKATAFAVGFKIFPVRAIFMWAGFLFPFYA
jgi:hypothetical protein